MSWCKKRKDKRAAERFFKKLMKGQGRSAREIVTDKLPSYGAARKAVMPTQCIAMIAMRIIVPRYRMNTREHRSGRCEGSSHRARRNDSWLFTVRFLISFVLVDISIELPTTDC